MKLEQINYKVKCDIPGCKNISSYALTNKHFYISSNLNICKDCLCELYESIGKLLTPKSPKNVLNNKK